MFNFFKEKLKGALSKFTKKAEEVPEEILKKPVEVEIKEEPVSQEDLTKDFIEKKAEIEKSVEETVKKIIKKREKPKEEVKKEPVEVKKEVEEVHDIKLKKIEEKKEIDEEPKKGLFKRITEKITTKKINDDEFDQLFWDLELVMLENNVAVEIIEKIKQDLKSVLVGTLLPRGDLEKTVQNRLKQSITELFQVESFDLIEKVKTKKPFVICFVGINGSGKTTTIAKVTNLLKKASLEVVIAAADTFRAAAIDQLQIHAEKLGVKLVKHDYGADAAAVAYDAIEHAKAKGKDVVLIDTAGRLHSNHNLIDEMKKIVRVAKPDMTIFVGESITGNDCVEQAKTFNEAVKIDGIILSKVDVDEKGGAALSISYVTGKPILYLGSGQKYEDLQPFDRAQMIKNLGL